MIGRRSEFSEEYQKIKFSSLQKRREFENITCMVLDICGAHKPNSRFLEEESFDSGIWLILGSPFLKKIFSVCWPGSNDEFRLVYGTDSNITGRIVTVKSKSLRKEDLRFGTVSFSETKNVSYQDPQEDGYFSLGVLSGISSNLEKQLDAHKSPNLTLTGEIWRPIK